MVKKIFLILFLIFYLSNAVCPENNTNLRKWSEQNFVGSSVTITRGNFILLDVSVTLNSLVIENGASLVIGKSNTQITLTAGYIIVFGSLLAGSSDCPYTGLFNIFLVEPTTILTQYSNYGKQVLGVGAGGLLELYGINVGRTWAPLRATLEVGSTTLSLASTTVPIRWKVGDEIVVASTSFDQEETETFFIKSISGNDITLDKPAVFSHYGVRDIVDERAEVGLLTRNIKIEGVPISANQGGHCIFQKDFAGVYINNVAFTRMGQLGVMGRYPIHFHMADDVAGRNRISMNSVYRCFQRSYAIHATNSVILEDNLAYSTNGHMYFLEDAVEEKNILQRNLGILVRPGTLLQSDVTGFSVFWLTNPTNIIRNNIAVGGFFGIWYNLPRASTGLSLNKMTNLQTKPLLEFRENKAHSNNRCFFLEDESYNPTVPALFDGFVGYKCVNGIWVRGGRIVYNNFVLAHGGGMTMAEQLGGGQVLQNSLFIAKTGNKPTEKPREIIGFNYYDGAVGISNITCIGFVDDGRTRAGCITVLIAARAIFTSTNYLNQVKFINSKAIFFRRNGTDIEKTAVITDRSGSVCNPAGLKVVKNNPLMLDSRSCTCSNVWEACCCDNKYVRFEFDTDENLVIKVWRSDIADRTAFLTFDAQRQGTGPNSKKAFTLMTGRRYYIGFVGATSKKYNVGFYNGFVGDALNVAICYPRSATNFRILKNAGPAGTLTQVNSIAQVDSSNGNAWFFNTATGYLHLRLISPSTRAWEADRKEDPNVQFEIQADFTQTTEENCYGRINSVESVPLAAGTVKPTLFNNGDVLEVDETLEYQE